MTQVESKAPVWGPAQPILTALLLLRLAIGWHFLYEGITKVLAPAWTSARYLSSAEWVFGGLFQQIAATPWMLRTADAVNAWGLTLIGVCLLLGGLTRIACVAGTAFLLLYSLAHPALPGMAGTSVGGGSYLVVDRNLVEALMLVVIALMPSGSLWGLDRLGARLRRRRTAAAPPEESGAAVPSAARRELMRDLTGVPVLGALAAAILGSRAAADQTAQVDAISGATPLLAASPAVGRAGNLVSVRDFEWLAQRTMSATSWAYVSGGAGDEQTLRWSEGAFRQIYLRQQVAASRTDPDTRVRLFGAELPHPIMLAPAGHQGNLHPEGEVATARGAESAAAVIIVSTVCSRTIEEIAAATSQPKWYQAYLVKDREAAKDNLRRAQAAGYSAICVTVDSSSNGSRDREFRYRQQRDPDAYLKYRKRPWTWPTTWEDVAWYRAQTKLPLIPKGIMTADDAERCLDAGADAVYISNHGGRNLDSGIVPVQVLPAIAERVAGRVPIILDGGIRRGTDVLKALALGATAVAIGRPFLYGLAVRGAEGVSGVVNMLRNELEMAMVLTGQTSLARLDASAVLAAPQYPRTIA